MSETTTIDEAQEQDDFGSGFTGKPAEKAALAKEKPESAETPRTEEESKPEFVQITKKDWDDVTAAARRTASYEQQFSRLFGTTGNITKQLGELQAKTAPTPQGKKFEISKEAFAEMEKDFPELAQQTRAAIEKALSGMAAGENAEPDMTKIEQMLASINSKREVEVLEDAYPDWRDIVGAVDTTKEQPNPDNAFRKWLATKDAAYQARINGTESAAVIGRAIRLFQNETRSPQKPATTPRDTARADRIRAAVQPKGDGAGAAPGKTDDEQQFEAGFNSR